MIYTVAVTILALIFAVLVLRKNQEIKALRELSVKTEEDIKMRFDEGLSFGNELELSLSNINIVTDEMLASINDISQNMSETAKRINFNLKDALNNKLIVDELSKRSEEIGETLKIIANVTHQVNILALNASIEAARAGEAGKGFEVVAEEIKELATQTKKATVDIADKVKAMQNESQKILKSISNSVESMRETNDLSKATATSVEKQKSFNQEIAGSIVACNENLKELILSLKTISKNLA